MTINNFYLMQNLFDDIIGDVKNGIKADYLDIYLIEKEEAVQ